MEVSLEKLHLLIFLQLNIEFINQNMYNKPIKGVACTYMCLQLRQYDI